MPSLCCGVVAVPNLEPCAVSCAAASDVEAATGLRVYEAALLSPAPLLGAGPIAIPELGLRPVDGTAAGDVHAFPENPSVPSSLFLVQLWALVPLHVQIWIAVLLFVLALASSMHLPPLPKIGPAPRYFALTTGGVSRL